VKITATAGELADALALAASLISPKIKIPALTAARIEAAGAIATIATNVGDYAITLTMPVTVAAAGVLAVPAARLAALAAGFNRDAAITITADGSVARVDCARSHFKLAVLPRDDLPAPLTLAEQLGKVALAREEVEHLLRPAFAASTEAARYYIGGLALSDDGGDLHAVATDGVRLVRTVIGGGAGLGIDPVIVPNAAVELIGKILRTNKAIENVTLRHSARLFELATATIIFTTKLIDATFPDCRRYLPKPSANTAIINRAELAQALARVLAIAEERNQRVVGLRWVERKPVLEILSVYGDAAADAIGAAVTGEGMTALQIPLLLEELDALTGERLCLDSAGTMEPALLTDPDAEDVLMVQSPCSWPGMKSQAA
jgi:DNA polymerase-3 subunit beta